MKIGRPFNTFKKEEYLSVLEEHKSYTDFNTLGLYRSILENDTLSIDDKKDVLAWANRFFHKTYEFLQIKDPATYFSLSTLGEELTKADEYQVWRNIIKNQERILKEKKIKHRNFGTYSIHDCGVSYCPYNGMMVKQGSKFSESEIHFESDKNRYGKQKKSFQFKKERKNQSRIIDDELDD